MRFKHKIALVTGGNSGIGRTIALRFAKEGARVVIVGRDPQKGQSALAELGDGAHAFRQVDLADEEAVKGLAAWLQEEMGHLDILINNAGAGARRGGVEPHDTPGQRWDKLRGINLDSGYFVSAYCLPLLKGSNAGAIVNVSSTATWHGNWGLYGIAKAGVEGMTRSFAAEAAPHGIRVNGVSPGWITTAQDKGQPASGSDGGWSMPPSLLNRMGTTDEIASVVLFLASEEASFVTGQTLIVDGGLMVLDYPSIPMLEKVGRRLYSQPEDE